MTDRYVVEKIDGQWRIGDTHRGVFLPDVYRTKKGAAIDVKLLNQQEEVRDMLTS